MKNTSVKNYWDKISGGYSVYWQSYAKQNINRKELSFINFHLKKTNQQNILDIGIGTGRILENYLKKSRGQNIYGLDIAPGMVGYCQSKFKKEKRIKSLKVCNIAVEKIPFGLKFNYISAIRILKYNNNWREILKKITSSLTHKGIFVFTIPNTYAIRRFTKSETPMHTATRKEIKKLCSCLDLEILELGAFSRLPDIFYDLSNNIISAKILLFSEMILEKLLGPVIFGKIFFVAVKKK